MNLRSAAGLAALVLSVGAMACTDEGYETTDLSTQLEVSPLFRGVRFGNAPVQFSATIGGDPVAVTWESSDQTIATVSATGLATPVNPDGGFVAVTATLTSNTARKKSASLTINPLYVTMTSGVARTGIAGEIGDTLYFRVNVPAGATNLTWTMSGGTGDLDLYVAYNRVPNYGAANWDCRPFEFGNNEVCSFPNPAAGFWYAWLDVYDNASGASLVATVTGP